MYWHVSEDHIFVSAAALAYSWLFAIFPFLIFVLSLLPYLPEKTKAAAKFEIHNMVRETLGPASGTIWDNVSMILDKRHNSLMGIGLLLTIWAASSGMNTTITALDRCYELPWGRPFYKKRPIAIAMTIVVAILILSVMALMPIGTIAIGLLEPYGHGRFAGPLLWTWKALRYPLAIVLLFTVLHIIYQYGPSIRQRIIYITPGAVFVVIVWLLLGFAFRFYIEKFGRYNETYGTVGGVAILLMLFYIDAAVLLMGAEINAELDFEVLKVARGSRDFRGPKRTKQPGESASAEAVPPADAKA